MEYIWNKKLLGLLGAVVNVLGILISRTTDLFITLLFTNNVRNCGRHVKVKRGLLYRYPSSISLGDDILLGHKLVLTKEPSSDGLLRIGDKVSIGDNCDIDFTGGVDIGNKVHIAHHVSIITHTHGYDYRNAPEGRSLFIGENAYIGSQVTILYNCNSIGKNSVIGIGSIVTKDVPDNAIVAGNPARILKYKQPEP